MEKKEKCNKCKKQFIRKFVPASQGWSKLNEVGYWIDKEGGDWKGWKILCRSCLKEWRENYPDDFLNLVSTKKKSRFRAYLYNGLFDRNDLIAKVKH